jgi:peptide-methionine (S)-S-oxide reductase
MEDLNEFPDPVEDVAFDPSRREQLAVLAGGCFWCVEAVFEPLDGVLSVTSGYAGDSGETATYEKVCSGTTDHVEVVEIRFDPGRISYGQLLKVFFSVAHDPTQLDRQGPDTGSQYRSAIFYLDQEQREVAERYIDQLERADVFDSPIVTRVESLEAFYEAEEYHQEYARRNPGQPYILFHAVPKVKKLREAFGSRLKKD